MNDDLGWRLRRAGIAIGLGVAGLILCFYGLRLLQGDTARFLGQLVLGVDPSAPTNWPFPLSIQALMWLIFALGIGELLQRYGSFRIEERQLQLRFLPEDDSAMLLAEDLGPLYQRMRRSLGDEDGFLPRLIRRIVFQFQSSRSISQANTLLNSSLELFNHEVDLRYSMLRYLIWLIPTLGFMGTVVGIALALEYAGGADYRDPTLLRELTARLAVAFNTTLLALLLSAVLVFLLHIIQAQEERVLNRIGQYCLDNLINRLYVSDKHN